ncbi:hypothetical protein [Rothia sp. ZJ932]|uniref:hypothetical protein n=1 Tax=Rothia sp. ZJ932 TaxID=2810516 RepID=UPI0019678E50|nr:hypothetical protein [Rothia sp. ZJ932]QRZ61782.1 hypothetical protein JR346_01170 [Rothia sp. ZJ932]
MTEKHQPPRTIEEALNLASKDPNIESKIKSFEHLRQMPPLSYGTAASVLEARTIRYILMSNNRETILMHTARQITHPQLWYALAGIPDPTVDSSNALWKHRQPRH